jgi:hypothetical protein
MGSSVGMLAPVGASRSVAVTILAVLTLAFGVGYSVLGGCLVFGGPVLSVPPGDPAGGFAWLLNIIGDLLRLIGIVLLVQGVIGLVAGLGTLQRRQ